MFAVAGQRTFFVVFILDSIKYGLDINNIQEIIRKPEIQTLPAPAGCLIGTINLHGNIIPVLDIKREQSGPATPLYNDTRVIIVEDIDQRTGLIVDEVVEVISVPNEKLIEGATAENPDYSEYTWGTARLETQTVIVFDARSILRARKPSLKSEA